MMRIHFYDYDPKIERAIKMIRDSKNNEQLMNMIAFCEKESMEDIENEQYEELELMK